MSGSLMRCIQVFILLFTATYKDMYDPRTHLSWSFDVCNFGGTPNGNLLFGGQ
jgi:hypothetical protein